MFIIAAVASPIAAVVVATSTANVAAVVVAAAHLAVVVIAPDSSSFSIFIPFLLLPLFHLSLLLVSDLDRGSEGYF